MVWVLRIACRVLAVLYRYLAALLRFGRLVAAKRKAEPSKAKKKKTAIGTRINRYDFTINKKYLERTPSSFQITLRSAEVVRLTLSKIELTRATRLCLTSCAEDY